MKELAEAIAKALVDYPNHVHIRAIEGEQVTVFELRVDPSDVSKISDETAAVICIVQKWNLHRVVAVCKPQFKSFVAHWSSLWKGGIEIKRPAAQITEAEALGAGLLRKWVLPDKT